MTVAAIVGLTLYVLWLHAKVARLQERDAYWCDLWCVADREYERHTGGRLLVGYGEVWMRRNDAKCGYVHKG